jgi:hypothetical protein
MKPIANIFMSLLSASALVSCSSGSDSVSDDAGSGRGGSQNGFLTLNITDAPIDHAEEVWVQFDAIKLKPVSDSEDDVITITFDPPKSIELLALQGQNSVPMLIDTTLPAGEYEWLRLSVSAENDGVLDSYIKIDDNAVHELSIPSGSESGLKIIGGLEVIANTPTSMTIDFDLRKSIVMTGSGEYKLKPVLKLVDDSKAGSITGTVEMSALTDDNCSDADPATGNAVYLFEGLNAEPDDEDGNEPDPVASAIPSLNNASGEYEYSFGFLPLGKYTAVFTCQADLDDPATDDDIAFSKGTNVNLADTETIPIKPFK